MPHHDWSITLFVYPSRLSDMASWRSHLHCSHWCDGLAIVWLDYGALQPPTSSFFSVLSAQWMYGEVYGNSWTFTFCLVSDTHTHNLIFSLPLFLSIVYFLWFYLLCLLTAIWSYPLVCLDITLIRRWQTTWRFIDAWCIIYIAGIAQLLEFGAGARRLYRCRRASRPMCRISRLLYSPVLPKRAHEKAETPDGRTRKGRPQRIPAGQIDREWCDDCEEFGESGRAHSHAE